VVYGDYEMVDDVPDDVFVYLRKYRGQMLLVCANFTNEFRRINLDKFGRQTSFISNYDEGIIDLSSKVLKPYEAFAIEVK
jgi:glucan 1,6-alpha-glucosidase